MIIQVDDLQVVFSRKNIKNLNLRIYANGLINLSAPHAYPMASIQRYLQEKKTWINIQRQRLQAKPQSAKDQQYCSGEKHEFLGTLYNLIIHEDTKLKEVNLENQNMHCFVPFGATAIIKQQIIYTWYREQMLVLLPDMIAKWEKVINVQVGSYHIKLMKTLWGSCNPSKKRICLNLNLIKKPSICLEYVIVHELVHLLEASHNKRFYGFMNTFMPDWKTYKALLK
jgi:predicted metal-dependent hydrolase